MSGGYPSLRCAKRGRNIGEVLGLLFVGTPALLFVFAVTCATVGLLGEFINYSIVEILFAILHFTIMYSVSLSES